MDRRRQNRLWLSCTECRTRKVKCDRARPCQRCVLAHNQDRCHYNVQPATARGAMPGQLVFAVETSDQRRHAQTPPPTTTTDAPRRPRPALSHDPPAAAVAPSTSPETGPVTPLQLLWHGSRSVDTYVEPLHGRTISTPKEVVFGENDATVYWGRSHETNFVPRITDAAQLLLADRNDLDDHDDDDNVSALYHIERSTRPGETVPVRAHDPGLRALLPPRAEADRLVDGYIRLFAAPYKIIHTPTFLRDYARLWDADVAVAGFGPPNLLAQVLGICAIGAAFVATEHAAAAAGQWIEVVRLWLFQQDPRMQMTLGHLQAHLLMLVAGDVHWIKIDRSWTSSGMLVRHAISAGLHREPSDFTRISPFYAELRRRLWYAILEFDLQASFAKGRTPSVRDDDYDCRPPLAIAHDEGLAESMAVADLAAAAAADRAAALPEPLYVCLAQSLALRTRVCRAVNGIHLTAEYGTVLQLDGELQAFLRAADRAIRAEAADDIGSGGQRILLTILTRRATIALHAPFLARTLYDARYLYSREVCVDTATTVLAEALALLDCGTPEAALLFGVVNSVCRCEMANSVFLLCHELLTQAVKRRRQPAPVQAAATGSDPQRLQALAALMERTAQATAAICKPDIVSQRTWAWMQLSAELARAAVGDDTTTVASMKESIGRSIQAYQASIHQAGPAMGTNEVDDNFLLRLAGSASVFDDDYFNLFLNLNNFDTGNPWI